MKVITFSRFFQKSHPRAGQPTFFVEKVWASLADKRTDFKIPDHCKDWDWYEYYNATPKIHTIRAGNRWKAGETFSARYWTGKPYASKQVEFAQIEIVKTMSFETFGLTTLVDGQPINSIQKQKLCINDGVSVEDFDSWLKPPFTGQIICWNTIDY